MTKSIRPPHLLSILVQAAELHEQKSHDDVLLELLEQSRELALEGQSSVALVHAKAALKIVRGV